MRLRRGRRRRRWLQGPAHLGAKPTVYARRRAMDLCIMSAQARPALAAHRRRSSASRNNFCASSASMPAARICIAARTADRLWRPHNSAWSTVASKSRAEVRSQYSEPPGRNRRRIQSPSTHAKSPPRRPRPAGRPVVSRRPAKAETERRAVAARHPRFSDTLAGPPRPHV
jgi:hypothetical protein